MNFYIKKNSTLPKLSVEVFIDSGTSFRNFSESFSSSTITFTMKDEVTGFYKIIDKPVTIKEKETNGDGPLKSYYLETQFTKKQTEKIGSYIGEFKIVNDNGIEILPISEKIIINIIESFVDSDFCCRPNIGDSEIVFPTETPKQSITPTPTPSISITPSITPSITTTVTPTITLTPTITTTPTPTLTPFLTPSVTPSITPTISVTPSITPSISVTPSVTPSISVTPSVTPSISLTPSVTPTINATPTPSATQGDKTIYVYYPNL